MFPSLEVDTEEELKKYEYYANELRPLVVETVGYLHSALKEGKRILVEGANAAMLDIDFGNYTILKIMYLMGCKLIKYLFYIMWYRYISICNIIKL